MSETITVEAVKDARDWNSSDGKINLTFYTLDIKREDGTTEEVDHGRQQGGAEPEPGEKLEVVFEDGKFRRKMKKAPNPHYAGGGGKEASTSGKGDTWKPRAPRSEYDPEDMARQTRSAAQDRAIRSWFAYSGGNNPSPENLKKILKEWTDFFEQDVIEAGQKAVAGQDGALPKQQDTPPPVEEEPAQQQPPADDSHQYLSSLLETAGLSSYPASKLADYVLGREPKVIAKAEQGLQDFDTQGKTLAGLKAAFERDEGEAVPSGPSGPMSGDDDIPFARPEYRPPFSERERWRR